LASSSREGDVLGILVSGSNLHTHQIGQGSEKYLLSRKSSGREGDVLGIE